MIRKSIIYGLAFLIALNANAQNFEQVSIYYDTAESKLGVVQKRILDSIIENLSNRRISINGHADYGGTEDKKQLIAEVRAKVVLRYLVDGGFPETQIINASGVGQAFNRKEQGLVFKENAKSRRTDILITKGPIVRGKVKGNPSSDTPTLIASATRRFEAKNNGKDNNKSEKKVIPIVVESVSQKIIKQDSSKVVVQAIQNPYQIDYRTLKIGDVIVLKNISFMPGMDIVMSSSEPEVGNLFQFLMLFPNLKIRLEGHICCSVYPDGYNSGTTGWRLSEQRARRIKTLLIERGINKERLSSCGFGHTKPIYTDANGPWEQEANRRVEIRVIEK